MTTDNPSKEAPGGSAPDAAGGGQGNHEPKPNGDGGSDKKPVAYESFQKLLDEKKALGRKYEDLEAKLNALTAEKQGAEREALEKAGNFEALYKQEKERASKLEADYTGLKSEFLTRAKTQAVLSKIQGSVHSDYWGYIPVDDVVFNPEANTFDETSIARAAQKFEKSHARLIDRPTPPGMPSEAPKGQGSPMSLEAWKKLPLNEQKQHQAAVYAAHFGKK
jgi:hypothetical protein